MNAFDRRIAELYDLRRELAGDLPLDLFDRTLVGASIQWQIAWQRFGRSMAAALLGFQIR